MIEHSLWTRVLLGFLVSPIAPGLFFALLGEAMGRNPGEAGLLLPLAAVIAYPSAVILGVPALLILRRFRLNGFGHYVLAGALMGVLVFLFLAPPHIQSTYLLQNGWQFLLVAVAAAVIASGTFWLIARPDTQPN